MERKIIQALKAHQIFLVTMHVNPDPDALGSAIAMALFLRSLGKTVRLINDGPCPLWLRFMPRSNLCKLFKPRERFFPEVVVVMDCGEARRIGRVEGFIRPGVKVINIDHHITNTYFGDLNLVTRSASSTSEIIFDLLKVSKHRLTSDMATLLYLGILTDTGSFGFDCTSAHTHEVIASLLKFNLRVSDLYRQVYETMPEKDLKAFLAFMNRLTLHHGERVACLTMTKRQAAKFSSDFDLKDKIFGFLRSVKGLEVIMILTEQEKKKTRLNFRSRGKVDVARFALAFNGGGHKNASGGFVDKPLAKARALMLAKIAAALPRI